MAKKLSKSELEKLEAGRDVWQEVLDGVKEIKAEFGTSMSAHHILGVEKLPRVRLFAD